VWTRSLRFSNLLTESAVAMLQCQAMAAQVILVDAHGAGNVQHLP
jgi:hypothetical protein